MCRYAAVLGRAMWEHGMRPHDLEADAASALEDAVGGGGLYGSMNPVDP